MSRYRNVWFWPDQPPAEHAGKSGQGFFKYWGGEYAYMEHKGLSIITKVRGRGALKRLARRIKADRSIFGRMSYATKTCRANPPKPPPPRGTVQKRVPRSIGGRSLLLAAALLASTDLTRPAFVAKHSP